MKIKKLMVLVLVIILSITGCTQKSNTKQEDSEESVPSLTVVSFDPVSSILPCNASSKSELFIVNHLFEGLYRYEQNGQIVNALASSEKSNETNTVWTFELDPDAVWSDGISVTSDDFLYSIEFALTSSKISSDSRILLQSIENANAFWNGECGIEDIGLTVISDTTFEVHFTSPVSHISSVMIQPLFFPMRRDKENVYSANIKDLNPKLLPYNGPYAITEFDSDCIVFDLNQKYMNKVSRKTESIQLIIRKSMSEVTFADKRDYLVLLNEPFLFSSSDYSLVSIAGFGTTFLRFNYSSPEYIKPDLRNALLLSVRNQDIASQLGDLYYPAEGFLSTAFTSDNNVTDFRNGYSPCDVSEGVFSNNTLVAKNMLEESQSPLHSLTMIYNREDPLQKELSSLLYETWQKNLNLEITPIGLNRFDYQDHLENNDFTLALETETLSLDMPQLMLELFCSDSIQNYGHFSSIKFDNCYNNCISASAYQDFCSYCMSADAVLYDDAAVIPLLYETHFCIVSSAFSSYTLVPSGTVIIN